MNYNDGQIHIEIFDNNEDMKKIAEDFSEGDQLLCDSLLTLWNNGIKTTACCRGHDEESPAYISLIIDENSKALIQVACEYLYIQDKDMQIQFSNDNVDYDRICIYMKTEEEKIEFLNFMNSFLTQKKDNQEAKTNIPLYGDYLLKFANKNGIKCNYYVTKDEMAFEYCHHGKLIPPEGVIQLSDSIDEIKETRDVPFMIAYSDEETLKQFINVLYPNSFEINEEIQK